MVIILHVYNEVTIRITMSCVQVLLENPLKILIKAGKVSRVCCQRRHRCETFLIASCAFG
jgi:hypothetical protein